MATGEELRKRRDALGMSQDDVAAAVRELAGRGFTQQSLAKLEKSGVSKMRSFVEAVLANKEAERASAPMTGMEAAAVSSLTTDEALLLERYRAEPDRKVKDFALTALINGYTSAPRHSSPSAAATSLLEEVFAGLLDMDLEAYFAKPEPDQRKEEVEIGRKVIGILDRRRRTLDPREVGREHERDSDKGKKPGIAK